MRSDVLARLRDARRSLLVVAAVCVLVAGVGIAVTDPFMTNHGANDTLDNGAPTRLATVQRRSLTAQQTLVGTVGYSGAWTVAVPAGASAADVQQAEQQVATARAAAITAKATLTADATALATASGAAQAARLKEASDCAGTNAAIAATAAETSNSASPQIGTDESPCQSSMQTAETTRTTLDTARGNLIADRAQLAAAQTTLRSAERALDAMKSASTTYGGSASFTALPSVGDVVTRGRTLYAINGQDTFLLYGRTPAWRSFTSGMSPGPDVSELNDNLRALGYSALVGPQFTSSTAQAIAAIQEAHGLPATGSLTLGSVVFEPSAARVTGVTPAIGQSVQAGPIMTLSSTRHSVSIELNPAQQSQVKVGNRVLITLPDNNTTPGVVDFVGKVATATGGAQSGTGNGNTPSLPVSVRLLNPSAVGDLDQAPVNVLITTASVRGALVVPVNALVALAGGGYAIEVVNAGGTHQLVAVTPGLFDDEEGLVQIRGQDIAVNQRVVVPAS